MPTRFLLGITENPGKFRIDLQNAVTCVEPNDGFWDSRKQPIEEGCKRVQRNVGPVASFSHSGNCSAARKENNSGQNVRERPMGHRLGYAFSGCAPSARSRRIHSRTQGGHWTNSTPLSSQLTRNRITSRSTKVTWPRSRIRRSQTSFIAHRTKAI